VLASPDLASDNYPAQRAGFHTVHASLIVCTRGVSKLPCALGLSLTDLVTSISEHYYDPGSDYSCSLNAIKSVISVGKSCLDQILIAIASGTVVRSELRFYRPAKVPQQGLLTSLAKIMVTRQSVPQRWRNRFRVFRSRQYL